jgi:O-antigen ligase
MLMVFLAASAIAIPLALSSLDNRFGAAPLADEYDERAAYGEAARAMASAHPLGVGSNTFVVVANSEGFYARAGVAPVFTSLSGHVHNVYLLIMAEMNVVGLAAFVWGLLVVAVSCLRGAMRDPASARGASLIGIFVSFAIVLTHSWFEWVFITATGQYFAAVAGAAGLALSKLRPDPVPQEPIRKAYPSGQAHVGSSQTAPSRRG